MPPLIALGLAITALGLLGMAASLALPVGRGSIAASDRLFDAGFGLFNVALAYWLVISIVAFFTEAPVHGV